MPKGVADGEYQAGLTYEDAAMRQVAGGAPVGVIYPQDGTSVPPDGNALIKGAKHPKAAQAVPGLRGLEGGHGSAGGEVLAALGPDGRAPAQGLRAASMRSRRWPTTWSGPARTMRPCIKKWQDIIVRVK